MDKTLKAQKLEIALVKMMENQTINSDDYNLIHKYLTKINNDLKHQNDKMRPTKT